MGGWVGRSYYKANLSRSEAEALVGLVELGNNIQHFNSLPPHQSEIYKVNKMAIVPVRGAKRGGDSSLSPLPPPNEFLQQLRSESRLVRENITKPSVNIENTSLSTTIPPRPHDINIIITIC